MWYRAARKRGVNDIASIARISLMDEKIEWYDFSHAEMDGIGAFHKYFPKLNIPIEKSSSRALGRPSWWRFPQLFYHGLTQLKTSPIDWIERNQTLKANDLHDFSWLVLTERETQLFNERLASLPFGQNGYLLSLCNNILLKKLVNLEKKSILGNWLFPVNMRGGLSGQNTIGNRSSGIVIPSRVGTDALEFHRLIKEKLTLEEHWSIWWLHQTSRFLGQRGVDFISRKTGNKTFYLGTFSNMGSWPNVTDQQYQDDDAWICTPPGTPNFPISIGILTWCGRLSLTLKIHPSICRNQKLPSLLIKEIKNSILEFGHGSK